MKWWKPLLILLLCATPSWAGFWSNDPGVGPGTVLNDVIFDNSTINSSTLNQSIINNSTMNGTTVFGPGSIVNYDPSTIINGPDGSIWNNEGITNLGGLTIAVGGSLTIPDGSQLNLPDGSNWVADGLSNLNLAPGGVITIGGIPAGGACAANQYYIALSSSLVPTCAPITSIPGPVTISSPTFTGSVTMPDGGTWTNTGILMSSTSHILIGFVNITGTMPGLTFNNVPMGGSCGTGDFVNSINANGVPSCGTPSGGGGSLPTPVSVGNGGLGQGVAPNASQILVASGPTAYNPVTMTGNVTISVAGVTTVNSLPSGITINNPVITGTVTLPNGSVTDAMLAGAYSGVGACAAGSVATTLNRNAPPTCSTMSSLGSGLWLPVNNPTYTGALSGPGFNASNGTLGITSNLTVGSGSSNIGLNGYVSIDNTTANDPLLVQNSGLPVIDAKANGQFLVYWQNTPTTVQVALQVDTSGNVLLNRNATLPLGAVTLQQMTAAISAAGAATYVGTTAPASPANGQLWFNSADLQTYIWWNDGTSSQWTAIVNQIGSGSGGGGFTAGGDLSGSPTSQTVVGIQTKPVPALAAGYLHYNGSAFVWDTPAGGGGGITSITAGTGLTGGTITTSGTIALAANPAGGALNFAPIASPTFTTQATAPTLNLTNETTTSLQWPHSSITSLGTSSVPNLAIQAGGYYNGTNWIATSTQVLGMTMFANGITFGYAGAAVGSPYTIGTIATISGSGINLPTGENYYINGVPISGGGVTSITAGTGLTGGTITTTGTIALATPVSIANGGTGTALGSLSVAQILVASSPTAFTNQTMSGDATLLVNGQVNVQGIQSKPVPALSSGYLHYTGSAFVWDTPAGGGSFLPLTGGTLTGPLAINVGQGGGIFFPTSSTLSQVQLSIGSNGVNILDICGGCTVNAGTYTAGAGTSPTIIEQNGNVLRFGFGNTSTTITAGSPFTPVFSVMMGPANLTSNLPPITVFNPLAPNNSAAVVAPSIQQGNAGLSVASGQNAGISSSGGLILIADTSNAHVAIYLCGNNACALISQSSGSNWVASTTAPAAGKESVAWSGVNYTVYNNVGSAQTYTELSFSTNLNS